MLDSGARVASFMCLSRDRVTVIDISSLAIAAWEYVARSIWPAELIGIACPRRIHGCWTCLRGVQCLHHRFVACPYPYVLAIVRWPMLGQAPGQSTWLNSIHHSVSDLLSATALLTQTIITAELPTSPRRRSCHLRVGTRAPCLLDAHP